MRQRRPSNIYTIYSVQFVEIKVQSTNDYLQKKKTRIPMVDHSEK